MKRLIIAYIKKMLGIRSPSCMSNYGIPYEYDAIERKEKVKVKKTIMSILTVIVAVIAILLILSNIGCDIPTDTATVDGTRKNIKDTEAVTGQLTAMQQTPTDINYSLERYNLIRRAYWVNGQREKAVSLPCQVERPLGYIVLFAGNATVGRFVVDGKVSSLNSYLSPDYTEEYYMEGGVINTQLADVDGSYGENDNGIFFFTPDGKYIEWTGEYLYSDIPFEVESPVVRYANGNNG